MTDEARKETRRAATPDTVAAEGFLDHLPFPVVAVGASAGGLQALEVLFRELPGKPGATFIVISHMDPGKKSHLAEILGKFTELPIREAEQDMILEPDSVYVIPHNQAMTISKGVLDLQERVSGSCLNHPIDIFFASLAQDQGCNSFCVILSGTGTDGTAGLREIKEAGGVVMVQDPATALHPGMPESAAATGLADFILPVDEIPATLARHLRIACDLSSSLKDQPEGSGEELVRKLLAILRTETGHDFSTYKLSTIGRRIQKRMLLANQSSLAAYTSLIEEDVNERLALFHDLLIGVTQFFRDREAFEALHKHVLPSLFKDKGPGDFIRVWVAGCSTGEEAYTVAILLSEYMERTKRSCEVKILATDIDQHAVETARHGVYPESIAGDLEPALLQKHFTHKGNAYVACPELRDSIVFARHDILRDPPFFRLDLVVCRNLLIYLNTDAQKKILSLFYYALNEDGCLFLGPSETVGSQTNLFSPLDRKWRIFKRMEAGGRQVRFPLQPPRHLAFEQMPHPMLDRRAGQGSASGIMEKALAERYGKASVLVDGELNAIRFHGDLDRYITVPKGDTTSNIYKLVRKSLRLQLRSAVSRALETRQPVEVPGLRTEHEGAHAFNLVVDPLDRHGKTSNLLLVIFEGVERPECATAERITEILSESAVVTQLEDELKATKDQLQDAVDGFDAVNEELKSSNEELMSMNEELQSSYEELETSKEELQALNEELSIMNSELQSKVEELAEANTYQENLFKSTNVATVFLDREMCIQRFTPAAAELFHLIDTDVHRPITDIASRIPDLDITGCARSALRTRNILEQEVQTSDGLWYLARLLPYRTPRQEMAGVVLTLVDITGIKTAEEALRAANEELEHRVEERTAQLRLAYEEAEETVRAMRAGEVDAIICAGDQGDQVFTLKGADHVYRMMVEQMSEAAATMNVDGSILYANPALPALLGCPAPDVLGKPFREFVSPQDRAAFDILLRQASQGKAKGEIMLAGETGATVPVYLSLSVLRLDETAVVSMLVTDLSARKEAEELSAREELFRTLAENSPDIIARYDLEFRHIYVSPVLQRHVDFPISEYIGKTNEEMGLPRELVEKWNKALQAALDTAKPVLIEFTLDVRGEEHFFHTLVAPEIVDGKVKSLISVAREITDRHKLEMELRAAKDDAERANRAKSEFLANMSHEIRTPMNGILGMTELALTEDISTNARDYLRYVKQSGRALMEIINDILDLSKVESGKVVLEHKPFRLRDSVGATLRSLQIGAESKGLGFFHSVDLDLPDHLAGDQGRLRQILTNLVGNAIKFTERGAVRVSVCMDRQPAAPGTVRLLFRVMDDGIGIPKERQEEVFQPFSQVGLSSHVKYGGTGLGLTISKELVELMGGRIWVDSEVGKGTTFSFTAEFELDEKIDRPDPASEQTSTLQRGKRLRILLAEDNLVNRILAEEFLKKSGHSVEAAENGRQALDKLKAENFDLVLMDIRMPDMNGEEAVHAIRSGEAGADKASVPVVALTAHALKGDRERFLTAGMDDYLSKPIDLQELDRVLMRVLKHKE